MCFFFFQAEDGIRDKLVTGVQTCALPIYRDGPRLVLLGGALRPHRRARRRGRRRVPARPRARACEPGAGAVAVLPQLRLFCGVRGGGPLPPPGPPPHPKGYPPPPPPRPPPGRPPPG